MALEDSSAAPEDLQVGEPLGLSNDTSIQPFAPAISRRRFVTSTVSAVASASAMIGASTGRGESTREVAGRTTPVASTTPPSGPQPSTPFLTPAQEFRDVSRGNPKPFKLEGQAREEARLTPDSWRLEITSDGVTDDVVKRPAQIARPLTIAEGTALTFEKLEELGRQHGVKYVKAMQCLNIPAPLGQGLWEGVPLRTVLQLCGEMQDVRRVVYWGFHNHDPRQMFRSSLSITQALETPPGELPPFLAYKLNGEPIPLERGGPVRMVIPWAHGFKSIKWLQQITLTNDFRANDTYAEQNNDPESHLKTAAYINSVPKQVAANQPLEIAGMAISGLSGLRRVEYWLHPVDPNSPMVTNDPAAWTQAQWTPCELDRPPGDWSQVFPAGVSSKVVLGFNPQSGEPTSWPMRYSMVPWSVTLGTLAVGRYEFRARAVDENGFAQPEPRALAKTGRNEVEVRRFKVS